MCFNLAGAIGGWILHKAITTTGARRGNPPWWYLAVQTWTLQRKESLMQSTSRMGRWVGLNWSLLPCIPPILHPLPLHSPPVLPPPLPLFPPSVFLSTLLPVPLPPLHLASPLLSPSPSPSLLISSISFLHLSIFGWQIKLCNRSTSSKLRKAVSILEVILQSMFS